VKWRSDDTLVFMLVAAIIVLIVLLVNQVGPVSGIRHHAPRGVPDATPVG
jgi:hypothetical protein